MSTIKKAAVIGAGVMGSGIAAHLANAGHDAVLLDIEKKFAEGGVARQLRVGGSGAHGKLRGAGAVDDRHVQAVRCLSNPRPHRGGSLAGRTTFHDGVVGHALAYVVTSVPSADPLRPLTENQVIALERQTFIELIATPATVDRVKHMLATGKPLRN